MLAQLLSHIGELQAERESLPKKPLSSTHMCMCLFTNPQTWTHVCLSLSQGWVHEATVQRALWLAVEHLLPVWCWISRFYDGSQDGAERSFYGGSPSSHS